MEIWSIGSTVECRGGGRTIGGYALRFGTRSRPMHGFVEQVAPSFVNRAQEHGFRGIIARYAHKDEYLLGATDSGSLQVRADARGVDYTVEIPDYHKFVYESVQRGDLRCSSFSFANPVDEWGFSDGMPLRTLLGGDFLEVAPTPIGQYDSADCGLRSLAAAKSASYADVKRYSETGQLAKFFTRSDKTGRSGRLALMEVEEMRPKPVPTLAERLVELTYMATPDIKTA